MTIDETIKRLNELIIEKRNEVYNLGIDYPCVITFDLEMYKQLAEWLEELKDYRDRNKMVVRVDVENIESISEKIDELSEYAECQYNKAIDDFVNNIKDELNRFEVKNLDTCVLFDFIDRKADKLKKGERE